MIITISNKEKERNVLVYKNCFMFFDDTIYKDKTWYQQRIYISPKKEYLHNNNNIDFEKLTEISFKVTHLPFDIDNTTCFKQIVDMMSNIEIGEKYEIFGNIQNGNQITQETITRKIKYITNEHVICECDRKFIRDENLYFIPLKWRIV
jgi:hypothetical protein